MSLEVFEVPVWALYREYSNAMSSVLGVMES